MAVEQASNYFLSFVRVVEEYDFSLSILESGEI